MLNKSRWQQAFDTIKQEVEEYEYQAEVNYTPNDRDKELLTDFAYGLLEQLYNQGLLKDD